MPAGIEIYNYVTNQKGSPALYSDTFANRPPAGFVGRLFISIDTFEVYRDNGTGWDLIGSGGGGGINIYNSDGNLLTNRQVNFNGNNLEFFQNSNLLLKINSGGADSKTIAFQSSGNNRIDFQIKDTEFGSNQGGNFYMNTYNDAGALLMTPFSFERRTGEKSMIAIENLTLGSSSVTGVYNITAGNYGAGVSYIGGNPHAASHNNFTMANGGNVTFANSIYLGAQSNVLRLQGDQNGTITLQQSTPGIRTAAVNLNQIQWNTTTGRAITYTHASVYQALGIYRLFAAGSLTVTNAYSLLLNDLNEYSYASVGGGALIITNRWGIYQDSTIDINYFGGNTLIGSTVNAGFKLDIAGTMRAQNTFTIRNNTAPASLTDSVQLYANDITAGNSALHLRTENGAILKLYQETTAVGSATFVSPGGGSVIKTDDTFDGYTLQKLVKALRNQGILA